MTLPTLTVPITAPLTVTPSPGPIMEAKVVAAEWLPFEGTLKGFNAAADAPTLAPKGSEGGETFEAKSMAGTDESV
jgi:hypothetical protein